MSLAKFKPREAVRILRDPPLQHFLKTWALARLLGWICLDQQRSRFRDRNAKLAGHLVLACLLDRRLRPSQIQNDNTAREMLGVFMNSGGFRLFVESRLGARSMLNRAGNKAAKDLGYVHRIMSYLCRYFRLVTDHSDVADGSKLTLEYAKLFVAKQGREFESSEATTRAGTATLVPSKCASLPSPLMRSKIPPFSGPGTRMSNNTISAVRDGDKVRSAEKQTPIASV
jgi:hypothetical protein